MVFLASIVILVGSIVAVYWLYEDPVGTLRMVCHGWPVVLMALGVMLYPAVREYVRKHPAKRIPTPGGGVILGDWEGNPPSRRRPR